MISSIRDSKIFKQNQSSSLPLPKFTISKIPLPALKHSPLNKLLKFFKTTNQNY